MLYNVSHLQWFGIDSSSKEHVLETSQDLAWKWFCRHLRRTHQASEQHWQLRCEFCRTFRTKKPRHAACKILAATCAPYPPFTVEALRVWSRRVCSSGLFLSRTRHGLEHTEIYRWIRWSRIFGNHWRKMFECELQFLQISSGYFLNAKGWDRLCSQAQRSPVGLCNTVFIRERCWVPKDVGLALSNMCFQECCSTGS